MCYSPPLLAGFRCRWWWAFLATSGGGSRARFPATPGWVLLSAVVCGVWCVVCGVWCAAVVYWWCCGWRVVWLVPRHSWRSFLCATPRHSWLGFAAGGGGRSSPLLARDADSQRIQFEFAEFGANSFAARIRCEFGLKFLVLRIRGEFALRIGRRRQNDHACAVCSPDEKLTLNCGMQQFL